MTTLFVRAAMLLALSFPVAAIAAKPMAKPAGKAAPAKAAPAAHDWLRTTTRTADGAIVTGNPAAKVKLVEYISLTCPHCAALAANEMAPLRRDYIATGKLSLEIRHVIFNPVDFTASLLARCLKPDDYVPAVTALFATQQQWMADAGKAWDLPGFQEMAGDQKIVAVAKAAGFPAFFAKRGMSAQAYGACLADTKGQATLLKLDSNAEQRDGVTSTPTVLINGTKYDGPHDWPTLETALKAAL